MAGKKMDKNERPTADLLGENCEWNSMLLLRLSLLKEVDWWRNGNGMGGQGIKGETVKRTNGQSRE
jgi:hypothetical protein